MTETVFLFSGQGSQYFQMGKPLYDSNETFRGWMQSLDEVVRRSAGVSVLETLYAAGNAKGDPFDRLLLTHPAIFMVEYSLAQALMHAGVVPDVVLGTSLGSFAAAAVAGYVGVEAALNAAIAQAKALEAAGEPGGMIAILSDPVLFEEAFLRGRSELAGVNFASHFVVSARRTELAGIEAELKQRNVAYQRLPVSYAFHSRWIDSARTKFEPAMRAVQFKSGTMPLVCCDRAELLSELPGDFFWDIVRRPIRFREAAARLEVRPGRRYVDVGPAGTLATFLKYGTSVATTSAVHAILTPFGADQKNFAAAVASAGH